MSNSLKTGLPILSLALLAASFSAADTTNFNFNEGTSSDNGRVLRAYLHSFEDDTSTSTVIQPWLSDGAVWLASGEYLASGQQRSLPLDFNQPVQFDIRFKYDGPIMPDVNGNFQRPVLTNSTSDNLGEGLDLSIVEDNYGAWVLRFKLGDGTSEGYIKDLGVVDPYSWQNVSIIFEMGLDTPQVDFIVNGITDTLVLDDPGRGDIEYITDFLSYNEYSRLTDNSVQYYVGGPSLEILDSSSSTLIVDTLSMGERSAYVDIGAPNVQSVTAFDSGKVRNSGATLEVDVTYQTSDRALVPGLGLRVHFDSSALNVDKVANYLGDSAMGFQIMEDTNDYDDTPSTDKYVLAAWLDTAGGWPSIESPTVRLLSLPLTLQGCYTSSALKFTAASTAAGYTFEADDYELVDSVEPYLDILGDHTVTLQVGDQYIDAGAYANDGDCDLTSSIATVNPVDVNTVGTYTITYNVIDASGNSAKPVTRTVTVTE